MKHDCELESFPWKELAAATAGVSAGAGSAGAAAPAAQRGLYCPAVQQLDDYVDPSRIGVCKSEKLSLALSPGKLPIITDKVKIAKKSLADRPEWGGVIGALLGAKLESIQELFERELVVKDDLCEVWLSAFSPNCIRHTGGHVAMPGCPQIVYTRENSAFHLTLYIQKFLETGLTLSQLQKYFESKEGWTWLENNTQLWFVPQGAMLGRRSEAHESAPCKHHDSCVAAG